MATVKSLLDVSSTALELVKSFKTMSCSRLQPPIPPQFTPTEFEDDAFTLVDCMSIFFGSGDGRVDKDNDSCRWQEREIDHEAAMNTLSSDTRDAGRRDVSSAGGYNRRTGGDRHHRCDQHRLHCRHKDGAEDHRRRHCRKCGKSHVSPVNKEKPPVNKPLPETQRHGSRRHRHRHRHGGKHKRRCFESFECVIVDPLVVEAVTPIDSPPLEWALTSVQAAEASCHLFLSSSCPPPHRTQRTWRLPALASKSSTSSQLSHPSRRWRKRIPVAPQPESPLRPSQQCYWRGRVCICERDGCDGGCGAVSEWPRCGASSNCNAEGSGYVAQDSMFHRRRSAWRGRRTPEDEKEQEAEEDMAAESSIYISASTASPRARSAPRPWRYLLEQPVPASHRVWVPVGAEAGRPPRKPQGSSGFTRTAVRTAARTATRTARSVSRHLRAVLCSSRRRLRYPCAASIKKDARKGSIIYPLPPLPPPQLQPIFQPIPPSFQPRRRPDANNNRNAGFEHNRAGGFDCLLRTLERAQLRRQQRRRQRNRPSPGARVDDGCVYENGQAVATATSSPALTLAPDFDAEASTASSGSLRQQKFNSNAATQRLQSKRRLSVELIKSMSASLVQLERSLQGCVKCIHGTLEQLCRDARK